MATAAVPSMGIDGRSQQAPSAAAGSAAMLETGVSALVSRTGDISQAFQVSAAVFCSMKYAFTRCKSTINTTGSQRWKLFETCISQEILCTLT